MPNIRGKSTDLDVKRLILVSLAFIITTLGLEMMSDGEGIHYPILLFIPGVLLLYVYVTHARKNLNVFHKSSIFPLELFKVKTFSIGLAGNFASRLGAQAIPFLLPLMLQLALGLTLWPVDMSLPAQKWAEAQASMPIKQGGMLAKKESIFARLSCLLNNRLPCSSIPWTWSGSSDALLRRRPLRTGRAGHPASGSSHYFSAIEVTGQLDGTFRGSTAGKVDVPSRIKWISQPPDLDMALDHDRRCSEELNTAGAVLVRPPRCKVPGPISIAQEVTFLNPLCSFRRVPTSRPLPESVPDMRVNHREDRFCHDVAMIRSPSPNDRVQSVDQHHLCGTRVALDDFPDLVEQRFDTFLRWLDQ